MPERSKGEVLRTSGVDSPRGFEPRPVHNAVVIENYFVANKIKISTWVL